MKVIQKCFVCWNVDNGTYYNQEIHASTAEQAKYKYLKSAFDSSRYTDVRCKRLNEMDIVELNGKVGKLSDLQREIETEKWRNSIKELQKRNPKANVLIYSGEHAKYWLPNKSNYTAKRENAGVYAIEDAAAIALGCGIEKQIELILV